LTAARAHIAGQSTPYVIAPPALSRIDDFSAFVTAGPRDETRWVKLLEAELIGRPVGAKAWVEGLEEPFNRTFSPQKARPQAEDGARR
jgi:hypothetical protein